MALTMTPSAMSDGQLDKLVSKFRDALRKHRDEISSDVAQEICGVENLGMECFAVIRRHADRFRNIVRLTVTTGKVFVKPDWMKRLVKGNDPLEPGEYALTFEPFLRDGESCVVGDEMVKRAESSGAVSGLQIALYLLENQHLIPTEFRGRKYLVFAGTEALGVGDDRNVAYLNWGGKQWVLYWSWLDNDFISDDLLVRARKL